MIDRRQFLALSATAALTPALQRISFGEPAPMKRPNFIFIIMDDQRFDALSCVQAEQKAAGLYPWIKTPNLDKLAAAGIRFRNAFSVNALCSPSRAAYLTGQYPHAVGVANNYTPFPENAVTHATLLRAAGYKTGYFGKWHHGEQKGKRPGFDFSASYHGHGNYLDCPFEINGKETPTKGWIDDVCTDYALDFLKQNRGEQFSIVIGYKSPHGPWIPPLRTDKFYAKDVCKEPANAHAKPPFAWKSGTNWAASTQRPGRDQDELMRDYFRTISAVDDNIGRLLEALDHLQLADDTVVVFASDHGYCHGEHTIRDKRCAYDESLRIPFLLRYPRLVAKGQIRDQMILNIDLAPTFLDLAGLPSEKSMHGKSLKPLLSANPDDFRESFLYEYFLERNNSVPTITALRTRDAKLVTYPGHEKWAELFDIKSDPYERKNLIADPASQPLRKKLETELQRQLKTTNYHVPTSAHERATQP